MFNKLTRLMPNLGTYLLGTLLFCSSYVFAQTPPCDATGLVDTDLINAAETILQDEIEYTVPSMTELKRRLKAVMEAPTDCNMVDLDFAITNRKDKNMPYNIVMNIFGEHAAYGNDGDPTNQMAFSWFTNSGITGGKVQILAGIDVSENDFDLPLYEINATCTPTGNLNYYNVSKNTDLVAIADIIPVNAQIEYTENKALVTGLTPGATYSFRVGQDGAWSEIGTFTTAEENGASFSFIYTTDPQAATYSNYDISQNASHVAFSNFPESNFWLHCGDLGDSGTSGQSLSSEWEWEQYFERQQDLFLKYPFAPVIGNHDNNLSKNFAKHFYTNHPSFDGIATVPGSTYSFVYGNTLFLALNSEACYNWFNYYTNDFGTYYNETYAQSLINWMREEVAAYPDVKWRIAYFHKPLYVAADENKNDHDIISWRNKMAPIFDELKIDLTLEGHDHVYKVAGPVFDKKLVEGAIVTEPENKPVDTYANLTGKSGGVFNTQIGTLYFLNSSAGHKKYEPFQLGDMNNVSGVNNYSSLFTGRLGQTPYPTFSNVTITDENITIATYEVLSSGSTQLFDKFTIVRPDFEVDGELVSILTESGEDLSSSEYIKVIIQNNGDQPLTGFRLILEIDGVEKAIETFNNAPIPSRSQAEYIFSTPVYLSMPKSYEITVTLVIDDDAVPENDSKTKIVANFSSEPVDLYAYRIYDNEFPERYDRYMSYGFISLSSDNPTEVKRINNFYPYPSSPNDYRPNAGERVDGIFYGYITERESGTSNNRRFVSISTDTWSVISSATISQMPFDMAYDYQEKIMYGLGGSSSSPILYTIDMVTGEMTLVVTLFSSAHTLACDSQGNLFIIDSDGILCTVDKTSGSVTKKGSTGFIPSSLQTMAFDQETGRLFWAMYNSSSEGKLIEISPSSGITFDRGTLGGDAELVGLYTFKPEYTIDGVLSQIVEPLEKTTGLTNDTEVKILIKNNGSLPMSNFSIELYLDGVLKATELYTGSIASGNYEEYTFNATLELSDIKTYQIKTVLDLTGDEEPGNNSAIKTVTNFSSEPVDMFAYRIWDTKINRPESYGFISFTSDLPANVARVNDYRVAPDIPNATHFYAGEYVDGFFYAYAVEGTGSTPSAFVKISTDNWETDYSTQVSETPRDMAYDHTTNTMYGITNYSYNSTTSTLVKIDMDNGTMSYPAGPFGTNAITIACSPKGDLFIVDTEGNLCSVNKSTGAATVIGSTGYTPDNIQTMSFDRNTGRLFWAARNNIDDGKLFEITPSSGIALDRGIIAGRAGLIGLTAIKTYTNTVSVNLIEGGTITGGGIYLDGANITVTATANEGYQFVNWTDQENVVVSEEASYQFTITKNYSLIANFEQGYLVTVSANPVEGGTVTGGGIYTEDELATVEATANPDYAFVNWTDHEGQEVSTNAIFTFTVPQYSILTANFAIAYTITASVDGEGGIIEPDGETVVVAGGSQTYTITPDEGYQIDQVLIDGVNDEDAVADGIYTFEDVDDDHTIVVSFIEIEEPMTYTITVSASPAAGGTVSGGGTNIPYGTSITVEAMANVGYQFVRWTKNDNGISTDAKYSFIVTEDVALVANFDLITYDVTVSPTTLLLAVGNESRLTATVLPDDATDKTVTWSSDKTDIANVDATTGMVTAVSVGFATITATMLHGGYTATCEVTVYQPVTGISLNSTSLSLEVGTWEQLTSIIAPANATNKNVTWTSSNEAIVKVNDNGIVSGIAAGTATITVRTEDGGYTATCAVTVTPLTSAEIMDKTLANLYPNPTSGKFILHFEIPGTYSVTILTMSGKVLQCQIINDQINRMDISNYPAGIYLVMIDDGKQKSTMRVVKEE